MSDEKKDVSADSAKATPAAPAAEPTLAKIPRSLQQIQQEYMKKVQELGNLTWQIEILKNQQQGLYAQLNELGIEASKLPPEAPKAPKLASVPTPPKAGGDGT